ncbi:MAG: hypothetical protein A2X55_12355 [Nitrospirae bacterium GWB2_47_37]|nr:MAG: hypothetical protein A2X55_12355 [Nitrospirae bacterium GWB2_47_37]HAK87958.1 hypothetical protein [Nitrospiraceae bacterium]
MALIVNSNIAAVNAQRNLGANNTQLGKSLEKLSSGLRINRAADDAAGLAIATKLNAQVKGLNQAVRNVNNAISLVQTAEGGYNTITNILQRMRELAVQSSSDENTATDRSNLKVEAEALLGELTRIATTTEFNTQTLTDGSFTGKYFHIGANYQQTVKIDAADVRAKSIGKRATVTGTLSDGGVNTGIGGNITTGEVKINGEQITTGTSDDQVSVLEIIGAEIETQGSFAATNADGGVHTATGGASITSYSTIVRLNDAGDIGSLLIENASFDTTALTASLAASLASMSTFAASIKVGDTATFIDGFASLQTNGYATIGATEGSGTIAAGTLTVNITGLMGSIAGSYSSIQFFASIGNTTAGSLVGGAAGTNVGVGTITASIQVASGYWYGATNYVKINGTSISYGTTASLKAYTFSTNASKASYITAISNLINNASVPYIKARTYASVEASGTIATAKGLVLIATKGVDLSLMGVGSGFAMATGLTGLGGTSVAASAFMTSTTSGDAGTITTYNGQTSALARAAAIDAVKGTTNVDGIANANIVTGNDTVAAGTLNTGSFYINGVNIGSVSVSAGDGSGELVTAINSFSSDTGVTASIANGKLTLTSADGRNISVFVDTTAAGVTKLSSGAASVNSTNNYRGTVSLNSKDSITISGTNVTELGSNIEAKTYAADLTYRVSLLDISSQSGAESAILSIDAALDQLNSKRSELGAIQNRLEFTVASLETASENMAASESRIRDADFAFETAKFTKNQILVQAGTAMLAQANTLPQIALQLLR